MTKAKGVGKVENRARRRFSHSISGFRVNHRYSCLVISYISSVLSNNSISRHIRILEKELVFIHLLGISISLKIWHLRIFRLKHCSLDLDHYMHL